MSHLIGEFDCKLDAKGRLMVPSGLKKQLPAVDAEGLVVNRGFEKHLTIYTKAEWDKITAELAGLNQFEKKTAYQCYFVSDKGKQFTAYANDLWNRFVSGEADFKLSHMTTSLWSGFGGASSMKTSTSTAMPRWASCWWV